MPKRFQSHRSIFVAIQRATVLGVAVAVVSVSACKGSGSDKDSAVMEPLDPEVVDVGELEDSASVLVLVDSLDRVDDESQATFVDNYEPPYAGEKRANGSLCSGKDECISTKCAGVGDNIEGVEPVCSECRKDTECNENPDAACLFDPNAGYFRCVTGFKGVSCNSNNGCWNFENHLTEDNPDQAEVSDSDVLKCSLLLGQTVIAGKYCGECEEDEQCVGNNGLDAAEYTHVCSPYFPVVANPDDVPEFRPHTRCVELGSLPDGYPCDFDGHGGDSGKSESKDPTGPKACQNHCDRVEYGEAYLGLCGECRTVGLESTENDCPEGYYCEPGVYGLDDVAGSRCLSEVVDVEEDQPILRAN